MRFLVVESSALAQNFEAGLEDALARDRDKCEAAMNRLGRRTFECEPDAEAAFGDTIKEPRLHRLTAQVVPEVHNLPRRRGRP